MATELNLSATQFIILVIILTLALAALWLKKSYFQLDIEPKTDTVTDITLHTKKVHTMGLIFKLKAIITTKENNHEIQNFQRQC